MNIVKKILFVIILVILATPGLLVIFPFIQEEELKGDFFLAKEPEFSKQNWLSGKFQKQTEEYLNEQIGFHNFLVRLNNQMDFSFFGLASTEGVVVGKENQMYERDYILEYTGDYFIGDEVIEKKVKQIKYLQEKLKKEFNKDLIIVFEPGKAEVLPEFIPDRYHPQERTRTNYKAYLDFCNKHKVNYLDLNKFFVDIRDSVSYPLYPRYGIHWSIYGMSLAADTLIKFIEKTTGDDLIDFRWEITSVSTEPRETDYDVGDAMNLLWNMNKETLAYPEPIFEQNPSKYRPRVLAIADSYYFNIYSSGIPENIFANKDFWYFGKKVFPASYNNSTTIKDIDVEKTIRSQDIILCMITGRFMHRAFWEKIDIMYKIFNSEAEPDLLMEAYIAITAYDEWFQKIYAESKIKKMPMHELLFKHASYVAFEKNKKQNQKSNQSQNSIKTREEWLNHYINLIKSNSQWLEKIKVKANEQKKTLDEMILIDAKWCLEDDLKKGKIQIKGDEKSIENAIQEIIREIKNSPKWLKHIEEKAKESDKTLEEMIRKDAEWTYKDRNKSKKS